VHDVRIVLAGEDIAGTTHVGRQLVNFIEIAIYYAMDGILLAQVGDNEVVCFGLGVFVKLEVHTTHPKTFTLEALDQMAADKAARAKYQCRLHSETFPSLCVPQSWEKPIAELAHQMPLGTCKLAE
jgi:hypothetical protein